MGNWNHHPKPPITVEPRVRTVAVVIKDQFDNPVEGVNTILAPGFDGFTNADGYLAWNNVPESLVTVEVLFSKDGYENKKENHFIPSGNYDLHLTLKKLNVFYPLNVSIVGLDYNVNGSKLYLKEATAFQNFADYCRNIEQFKSYNEGARNTLRVNTLNILGMFNGGLGEFSPRTEPLYFEKVRAYCRDTYNLGWIIEFTVFADAQNIFTEKDEILAFARKMRGILIQWPHILIRICNEPYKNLPSFITIEELHEVFSESPIFGNGETNDDASVYEPIGTEITNHPSRDSEWMRKAKNSLELRDKYDVPVRDNECIRPDQALTLVDTGHDINDQNIVLRQAEEFAAIGKLYGIPQCLHSQDLKFGKIPSGFDLEFFLRMNKAYDKVPSGFEHGSYFNPATIQPCPVKDSPECLRIYGSQVGDEAYVIIVQPTDEFELEANEGWVITAIENNLYAMLRRI